MNIFRKCINLPFRILFYLKHEYRQFQFKYKQNSGAILEFPLVRIHNVAEKVSVFKPRTEEVVYIPPIYGFIKSGSFTIDYPEIALWKLKDAIAYHRSDFIRVGNEIVWEKYYAYNFCKNIASDRFLIKSDKDKIYIKKEDVLSYVDVAFSLLGVHSQIWSHSLSEYFTKISQLSDALQDANTTITVLVTEYSDVQLKQIIYSELGKFQNIEIKEVKAGEAVHANVLYYMERPCKFTDHENYVEIGDSLQPRIVADIIKDTLVYPYLKQLNLPNDNKPLKLYLPRSSKKGRALLNTEEIEAFFREQGYCFLEPHTVTLEEKIRLFNQAEIIVGPSSSAFSNMIFSKPGTKVLIMTNYNRAFESWLTMHAQHFGMDMLYVTGQDTNIGNISHCSFYIPLEKIKRACEYHGII